MDLICYLHEGWAPDIRPASSRREWMDETPESFAYRCLPLNIANAHGWEVRSAVGCAARWDGGTGTDAVEIRLDAGAPPHLGPVSLFGQGVLTFHIAGILRTPPGWNLFVSGPPNAAKDGIAPLSGVIETDWSPFTFTMNWRFTRPGEWIRFEVAEPVAFFFPVQRNALAQFAPKFVPLAANPELAAQFETWTAARNAFHAAVAASPPADPADGWQKHYYRGVDASGCPGAGDHQTKLRTAPWAATASVVP